MRIQLLRLGTLLIRNLPDELVSHRKELIKFGWNHLKSEDSGAKQWAFVNVCHFLEAYQAPEKIVLQVFVALLRACQPEAKELVRQALGALTPALPKRLPQWRPQIPHLDSLHEEPFSWRRDTRCRILFTSGTSSCSTSRTLPEPRAGIRPSDGQLSVSSRSTLEQTPQRTVLSISLASDHPRLGGARKGPVTAERRRKRTTPRKRRS